MATILDRVAFLSPDRSAENDQPNGLPEELDPEPSEQARRPLKRERAEPARATPKRAGGRFTSKLQTQKNIADELNAYTKMISLAVSVRDEECAAVINDQSKAIADSLASLVARSDWLTERFSTTTMLADVVKLGHALLPVGRAMLAHGHLPFGPARVPQEGTPDDATGPDYSRFAAYQPNSAPATY